MSSIEIQGTKLEYGDDGVIAFDEGLVGMPGLQRLVLVKEDGIEPFLWLAAADGDAPTFSVADPRAIFPGYAPEIPDDIRHRLGLEPGENPLVLSVVTIARDWTGSTVNLRAPIFVCASRMRGAQAILSSSSFRVDERLPLAEVA